MGFGCFDEEIEFKNQDLTPVSQDSKARHTGPGFA